MTTPVENGIPCIGRVAELMAKFEGIKRGGQTDSSATGSGGRVAGLVAKFEGVKCGSRAESSATRSSGRMTGRMAGLVAKFEGATSDGKAASSAIGSGGRVAELVANFESVKRSDRADSSAAGFGGPRGGIWSSVVVRTRGSGSENGRRARGGFGNCQVREPGTLEPSQRQNGQRDRVDDESHGPAASAALNATVMGRAVGADDDDHYYRCDLPAGIAYADGVVFVPNAISYTPATDVTATPLNFSISRDKIGSIGSDSQVDSTAAKFDVPHKGGSGDRQNHGPVAFAVVTHTVRAEDGGHYYRCKFPAKICIDGVVYVPGAISYVPVTEGMAALSGGRWDFECSVNRP